MLKAGDERAYHEVVNRYGNYLYRLSYLLTGNSADAEDVLQNAFAGAFKSMGGFARNSSIKTWLSRIVANQAARFHRTSKKHRQNAELGDCPPNGIIKYDNDTRLDIVAALGSLPHMHREILVLREMQGMNYREIAGVLGVPMGTVESRLSRARGELRKLLEDYRLTPEA